MRYRTIVCDPPWAYKDGWAPKRFALYGKGREGNGRRIALPYPSLTVEEIAALPVADLAEPGGCHLYLWTTNRYLPAAFGVLQAWEFRYSQLLVWAKTPMGLGPGGTFAQNAEFVLFSRRGTLRSKRRIDTVWFNWPRTGKHSQKPEHFLDMVESVSPGPFLEMFSRRRRLNWSAWGDEVAADISLPLEVAR